MPSEDCRRQLFKLNLKDTNLEPYIDFELLVQKTNGYSCADISNVCREAIMVHIRRKLLTLPNEFKVYDIEHAEISLTMNDFSAAIQNIKQSVSKQNLLVYSQ